MRSQQLKGHLDLLVLTALRGRPAHGYLVLDRLSRWSQGEFTLPEATVYAALHRLERAGLLESRAVEHAGRQRRVYRLTAGGEQALAGERRQWERFAAGMQRTLEAAG